MKPTAKEYNDQLDSIANNAMSAVLRSIYANPKMLEMINDVALSRNLALVDEIAERSYVTASSMMRIRKKYLMKDGEANNNKS